MDFGATTDDDIDERAVQRLTANIASSKLPPRTRPLAIEVGESSLCLLFPHLSNGCYPCDVAEAMVALRRRVSEWLDVIEPVYPNLSRGVAAKFVNGLPAIYETLYNDAESIFRRDPAAESLDEVILAYPGFRAIATYRVANQLFDLGVPILPRLLTEWAHTLTGADIHPGARIGRNFVIDHATGVVIGETSVIGNGVTLYQGVTLGAPMVARENRGHKRHPTVEDNVIIYAHATILGGDTIIGHDSIVGGNAWITESVPPFSTVNRQSEVQPRRSRRGSDDVEFHI